MVSLHKVFVGCPFTQTIYRNYDRLKGEVEAETPLEIVLPDKTELAAAHHLLDHITDLIRGSAACIFDVTGSNPNVALEVGIAHAVPVKFLITRNRRKPRKSGSKSTGAQVRPIIADLKGIVLVDYTSYAALKDQLYRRYFSSMPLFKRWREFKRKYRAFVPYALKVFQEMREAGPLKSPKITAILADSGINTRDFLKALKESNLISEKKGKDGGFYFASR